MAAHRPLSVITMYRENYSLSNELKSRPVDVSRIFAMEGVRREDLGILQGAGEVQGQNSSRESGAQSPRNRTKMLN